MHFTQTRKSHRKVGWIVGRRVDVLEYSGHTIEAAEEWPFLKRLCLELGCSCRFSIDVVPELTEYDQREWSILPVQCVCPITTGGRPGNPGGSTMLTARGPWRCFMANLVGFLFSPPGSGGNRAWGQGCVADTIMLRGGGQVEGKVVPDPKDKDQVQVWLVKGRKPLSFQKAQILEVVTKTSALDDYFDKKKKSSETPQGQFDLGIWCEQNKLDDLARLHFEDALSIDKSFEPAHKKLGHVFHGGYWVTRDELNSIQGLVKYKGRWVSAEERLSANAEDKALAATAKSGFSGSRCSGNRSSPAPRTADARPSRS